MNYQNGGLAQRPEVVGSSFLGHKQALSPSRSNYYDVCQAGWITTVLCRLPETEFDYGEGHLSNEDS